MVRVKRTKSQDTDDGGSDFPGIQISNEPEPTPGLVPLGIPGFYQSPAEPVDPYDCERWPDSPYCGGNPINDRFLDLGTDVSVNPCEICFTISPTLAYISLPPYTICKRSSSPECTPQRTPPPPPPPNYPPMPPGDLIEIPKDQSGLYGGCVGETYLVTLLGTVFRNVQFEPPIEYKLGGDRELTWEMEGPIEFSYFKKTFTDPFWGFAAWNWVVKSGGAYTQLNDWNPRGIQGLQEYSSTRRWDINPGGYVNLRILVRRPDGRTSDACDTPQPDREPETQYLPPPYKPPNKNCCMGCCSNSNNNESNELLRLIARRLGTSAYPFTVPQSLNAEKSRSTRSLQSLSEVMEWFILQFDALSGQFPIEIEIEDTDPTKQGNQTQKIKIDNIAEGLAELIGVGLNASINTETLVNIGIRTLTEAGTAKNAAIVAQDVALANAEYLDYELKQITREVPSTFTPGKVELDDILKESTTKIRSYENVDDHQLKDYLTELLQGVSIIRAAFFRKLETNQPVKSQVKDILKNLISLSENNLSKDEKGNPTESKPADDFDTFLERVERGFSDTPGIQDGDNPYGREVTERPRIRELGKQED